MALLALYFTLSIVFSFLCSIWESVLLSVTPSYIYEKKKEGSPIGAQLEEYKKDIDRPLSAILTLNTIAHTVGAIGVGAQASVLFGSSEFNLGPLTLSYESLIAGLMTLAILILSEIIPKTLGATYWKPLTPFTVSSLNILLFVLKPFVWLSQLITKSLKSKDQDSVLSRANFTNLVSMGYESGAIQETEYEIINNLLRLRELKAKDIMTPRSVAFILNEKMTVKEVMDQHENIRFSRIPIYNQQRDKITGMVLKDDILLCLAKDEDGTTLDQLRRPMDVIAPDLPLTNLFEILIKRREHIAVIMDEYGSFIGIVTMEDLLETILGLEITDEMDKVEDLQAWARDKWKERAAQYGLTEHES